MPFLSVLDNFLQDSYAIFQKGVNYFEIDHKTCQVLVGGGVPP